LKNKFYNLHLHCALGPRVDPWLGAPEADLSIAGYRDAYERAYHSCYGPNTSAALRDPYDEGRVIDLVNNFESVGFDASLELLSWLETRHPRVYRRLQAADAAQCREFGHGGALAVPYPPLLLPLAPRRDKRTVVRWGLEDFRRRFGRDAEGMWLPENAIDDETCEILIEAGIRFTVAARTQAASVRPVGADDDAWIETTPETLDPRRPYRWSSKEQPGRRLAVFAYRTDLSPRAMLTRTALASDDALAVDACQSFANRLIDSLTANDAAELAHLAIDGEWFGLIHPYGERALAFTLDLLEREAPALRANYAAFLELFPPPQEIELKPASARSCPHGLERWRGDCSCAGEGAGNWRAPLRFALERLGRDASEAAFALVRPLCADPEDALNAAGPVLFSSPANRVEDFLADAATRHPTPEQARRLLRAAEVRRAALAPLAHWTWQGDGPLSADAVEALAACSRAVFVLSLESPERAVAVESALLDELARVPDPSAAASGIADAYRRIAGLRSVGVRRAAAHEALFLALRERVACLPVLEAPFLEFSFSLLSRRDRPERGGQARLFVFSAAVRDRRTFDRFQGVAVVLDAGAAAVDCWTEPSDDPERDSSELERLFVDSGAEALRSACAQRFDSRAWGIDGMLGETRRAVARELSARRSGDADADQLRARWQALIATLETSAGDPEAVASLLADSVPIANDPDAARGMERIRRQLSGSAARFAEAPSPETAAPVRRLLTAARDSALPLNVWELRDLARAGLARAGNALGEDDRRELLSMLGLAETALKEERWSPAS